MRRNGLRRSTIRRAVAGALLLVALAGCSAPPAAPAPAPPSAAASPAPRQPDDGSGGPSAAELAGDIETAVTVTNAFWGRHWSEYFTGSYVPPTVKGPYGAPYTEPTCGGRPPEADNAFYCGPGEDFLAWDVDLMAQGAEQGDAWVYLIVAHEWGHAIQARLGRELQSESAELQADCLAGATLYGAAADGTLQFEEGDQQEITRALSSLADETAWTQEGDHGDTFERIGAFGQGRSGGVNACLPTA